MEERKIYSELANIDAFACVLGLRFPESANEFQKSCLTLAHLYAALRDFVLKGEEIPTQLIELADSLNSICYDERFKQR